MQMRHTSPPKIEEYITPPTHSCIHFSLTHILPHNPQNSPLGTLLSFIKLLAIVFTAEPVTGQALKFTGSWSNNWFADLTVVTHQSNKV